MNDVLAKLEVPKKVFLDRRAAERLAFSWDLISQLLGRVLLEILVDVILLCDFCRVGLVLGLELSYPGLVLGLLLDLDACSVELVYSAFLILMLAALRFKGVNKLLFIINR